MNFTEFNLNEKLLKGIEAAGYVECTPVQEQVIKASQNVAEGVKAPDLYVQSQTGTGKTAAYLIGVIQELLSKAENKGKKLLVLVPTRELAVQVEEEAKTLLSDSGLKAFSVYGGVGYEKQIATLKKGVDVIIGTPGRVIDLQEGGNLVLTDANFVVIDEADRMFDMGFYPDLRKILKCLPEAENRTTMLFSATLNSYVKNLAWEYTRDAVEITIEAENITVSEIDQELLHVSSTDKMRLLVGILKKENPATAIVFCNTKRSCEVVSKRLAMNDIKSEFIIGDLPQSKRLQVIKAFKAGSIPVLVATDVAARGLDVDDLAMVINYDLPVEAENYVHRIGRTARAGKSGKAYTFCSEQDVYNLPAIERYIEMSIPATVAYEDQMTEDKSAGVYIKTENWRDDDELDSRGRKGNGRGGHDRNGGKSGSYHKDSRNHDGNRKNGDSYKGKNQKKGDYHKDNKKPYIDPEKLANMSYEERMKLYKEKYASSDRKSQDRNDRNYKGGKKNYNKSGNSYNKNGGKNYSKNKNYDKNNKSYNNTKNNNKKYNNSKKQAAPQKKGLFAKIKALFGKKN